MFLSDFKCLFFKVTIVILLNTGGERGAQEVHYWMVHLIYKLHLKAGFYIKYNDNFGFGRKNYF